MPAMPIEEVNEPVLTLEEFSRKLNVTTKTINRWRKRGLIGLPVIHKGRRLVGFLPSLTDPFLAANREHVSRSGRFSQMTEQDKEDILQRARQSGSARRREPDGDQPPRRAKIWAEPRKPFATPCVTGTANTRSNRFSRP